MLNKLLSAINNQYLRFLILYLFGMMLFAIIAFALRILLLLLKTSF